MAEITLRLPLNLAPSAVVLYHLPALARPARLSTRVSTP